MTRSAAPDQVARDRIASDLDATLFVEAGAGSGKTTALVGRVVALVGAGVPIEEIAAITFTEKAAAELRERIRGALARARRNEHSDQLELVARYEAAEAAADLAPIQTLHAFAQRILVEHAVAAGLPPGFEVVDEVTSEVAFAQRWRRFLNRIFADESIRVPLRRFLGLQRNLGVLRDIAVELGDNWDRLDAIVWPEPDDGPIDLGPLGDAVAALSALAPRCLHPDDKLLVGLGRIDGWWKSLGAAVDETELVERLLERPKVNKNHGTVQAWPNGAKAEVQAALRRVEADTDQVRQTVIDQALLRLTAAIAQFTLDAAEDRRANGEVEFHDLLVHARAVLRDEAVRRRVAARYRYLLLDEFQDTDPIQLDLACRIAAIPGDGPLPDRTEDVALADGRLFFVGDLKQSIYRFRRADVGTFVAARERLGEGGALELVANFRSVRSIVDLVNDTFGTLMADLGPGQPTYQPLVATRDDTEDRHPAVLAIGMRHEKEENIAAETARELEAAELAATLRTMVSQGWPVLADGSQRPMRWSDVAVLLPSRVALPALDVAFHAAGIPFRVETGSLVYATREIRDLHLVLRAVADRTDQLALVASLRSAIFACSDTDLYDYRQAGGRWSVFAVLPATLGPEHPVVVGLAQLREWHERRWWKDPPTLIEEIIARRNLAGLAYAEARPRDVWRRLRFVAAQARQWYDAVGGDLRGYLEWARLQASEGARVAEPLVDDLDDDAARVMTIHAAKGLEFPVVGIMGLGTRPSSAAKRVHLLFGEDPTRPPELRAGSGIQTADYAALADIEDQLDDAERLRLLYVALTRARDRLVVSVRHTASNGRSLAARLDEVLPDRVRYAPPQSRLAELAEPMASASPGSFPSPDRWSQQRQALLAAAGQPVVLAATAIRKLGERDSAAAEPEPSNLQDDLDPDGQPGPSRRGRAGTAVGRATHAVLQLVDLAIGFDDPQLGTLAKSLAVAEGIEGLGDEVRARAVSALASEPLDQARRADRVWRELFVTAPVAGPGERAVVLEGFVDLVSEVDGKLHIVDYKTDGVRNEAEIARTVAGYRLQGAAYALMLTRVTGRPVRSCTFVFCQDGPAIVRPIVDLHDAMAEVEDLVARRPRPAGPVQLDLFGDLGGTGTLFDVPSPTEGRR